MGGIYAREEGQPRAGVEGDLPPLPADRRRGGCAADRARSSARLRSTWAAVSLADKLDTFGWLTSRGRAGDRVPRSVRAAAADARRGENPDGSARARPGSIARSASDVCSTARQGPSSPPARGIADAGRAGVRAGARALRARTARYAGRGRPRCDCRVGRRQAAPRQARRRPPCRRCARRTTSRRSPCCSSASRTSHASSPRARTLGSRPRSASRRSWHCWPSSMRAARAYRSVARPRDYRRAFTEIAGLAAGR